MKKIISISLCLLILLSASACGKKQNTTPAPAPDNTQEEQAQTAPKPNKEVPPEKSTDERTPETDKSEIQSNLKDAQELIDNGDTDDALMIIKALESRDLTDDEKELVIQMKKQISEVAD